MNLSIQSANYNLNSIQKVKYSKYQSNVSFGHNLRSDEFVSSESNNSNNSNKTSHKSLKERFVSLFSPSSKKKPDNVPINNEELEKLLTGLQGEETDVQSLKETVNKSVKMMIRMNNELAARDKQIAELEEEVEIFRGQVLTSDEIMESVQQEKEAVEQKIADVIEAYDNGEINPVKREKLLNKIQSGKLNYDSLNPWFEEDAPKFSKSEYKYKYSEIKTGTNNRADMSNLYIPPLERDGSFHFVLPNGVMKPKKCELKKFSEPFEIKSNISEKYDSSLVWDKDKVARDLLQNFFDGHGQTLDGVKFDFSKGSTKKYRVRIEGKSTYNYKEAILMGESTSHENEKAAGNYGEGLKMVTLKLLKQCGAPEVKIGSGNWEVNCAMKKDDRLDSQLMNYKVSPVENFDGNFIEFETSDKEMLETLRNTINRFYHSSNLDFKEPDFENDLFGFKVLPEGQKGGLYISGQRFQYEGDYSGIDGGVIFIKRKIPVEQYDMSRDRTSIKSSDFRDVATWLMKNTSFEEKKQILKSLEPFANQKTIYPMANLLNRCVDKLSDDIIYQKKGAIEFPENYAARALIMSSEREFDMKEKGYKLFPREYENLGMKSVSSLIREARKHTPIKPTKTEKEKILILRKALNSLGSLKGTHFTKDELDANIYIFDAKSDRENAIEKYEYVQAEALVDWSHYDKHVHKGFWIDRDYLRVSSFPAVLETALHELSHKVDGDGTKEFGYELTNVNRLAIKQMINEPKLVEEFRILDDIWNKL